MTAIPKPDEIMVSPNAPTLNDKMALVNEVAESKVSLDVDAISPLVYISP